MRCQVEASVRRRLIVPSVPPATVRGRQVTRAGSGIGIVGGIGIRILSCSSRCLRATVVGGVAHAPDGRGLPHDRLAGEVLTARPVVPRSRGMGDLRQEGARPLLGWRSRPEARRARSMGRRPEPQDGRTGIPTKLVSRPPRRLVSGAVCFTLRRILEPPRSSAAAAGRPAAAARSAGVTREVGLSGRTDGRESCRSLR